MRRCGYQPLSLVNGVLHLNMVSKNKKVAGKNGLGLKCVNVFSTEFTIRTACKDFDKRFHKSPQIFKKSWTENMENAGEHDIKKFEGDDFTEVTYTPDFTQFGMTEIDDNTCCLKSRHIVDMAAMGIKMYVNGDNIPIYDFQHYVDLFFKVSKEDQPDAGAGSAKPPIPCIYEKGGERWEFAVGASSEGFQTTSFVNGIRTEDDGKHVEHVLKIIEPISSQEEKQN